MHTIGFCSCCAAMPRPASRACVSWRGPSSRTATARGGAGRAHRMARLRDGLRGEREGRRGRPREPSSSRSRSSTGPTSPLSRPRRAFLRWGRSVVFLEADLWSLDGRLIARVSSTPASSCGEAPGRPAAARSATTPARAPPGPPRRARPAPGRPESSAPPLLRKGNAIGITGCSRRDPRARP